MEVKEGDIVKFGHMNGASVKEGTHAPQVHPSLIYGGLPFPALM